MRYVANKPFKFAGRVQEPGAPVVGANGETLSSFDSCRKATALVRQGAVSLVDEHGTVIDGREVSPRGTMRRSRWGITPYGGTGR